MYAKHIRSNRTKRLDFTLIELPAVIRMKATVFTLIKLLAFQGIPRRGKRLMSFTLIELLVVIAIIGILASMLLPALKNAREMGRSAVCKSHLKQFGVVSKMYQDDYDNYTLTYSNLDNDCCWFNQTGMYMGMGNTPQDVYTEIKAKNTIMTCPSHRSRTGSGGMKGFYGVCYGMNYHFSSNCATDYWNDGGLHPKTTMVKRPSSLIYLLESDRREVLASTPTKVYGYTPYLDQPDGGLRIEKTWHIQMPNHLLFDGHVDNAKWGSLPSSATYEGKHTWYLGAQGGGR